MSKQQIAGIWFTESKDITIFAEIFVIVLISDDTFITKFKRFE